jgi:hypothetical protein
MERADGELIEQPKPAASFLDGNLLISNDPYEGVTVANGKLVPPDGPGLGLKKVTTGA